MKNEKKKKKTVNVVKGKKMYTAFTNAHSHTFTPGLDK
jgi:hypothetical protein